MAREAGIELDLIDEDQGQIWYITTEGMKAFEALVRADAIADEREACAKVADVLAADYGKAGLHMTFQALSATATRIRAKGETK
jgi:hypothetical protein